MCFLFGLREANEDGWALQRPPRDPPSHSCLVCFAQKYMSKIGIPGMYSAARPQESQKFAGDPRYRVWGSIPACVLGFNEN